MHALYEFDAIALKGLFYYDYYFGGGDWFARDDGIEERYSVLINFDDLGKATAFYHSFNGTRFSTSEVLFSSL